MEKGPINGKGPSVHLDSTWSLTVGGPELSSTHCPPRTQIEIVIPRGAAIYCSKELLALKHAHGANGRSISMVIEVSRPCMPAAASSKEIAAAAQAQPQLPLEEHFGGDKWQPADFKGDKLKFGAGRGVGSVRRCAIAWLRGPKQGRGKRRLGLSRRHARARVDAMTQEEREAAAGAWGRFIGALSQSEHISRHPQPPHTQHAPPPRGWTRRRCDRSCALTSSVAHELSSSLAQ